MGQALCSCGGRADDDHALLFGAALAKAKLQHQHQQRFGGRSPLTAKKAALLEQQQHGSLYHSRGETNELSDDIYISAAGVGDDALYYDAEHHRTVVLVNRQSSALALAEAFKQKLAESPLGPHEKMQFLLAPRASSSSLPTPDADAYEFGFAGADAYADDLDEHVSEEDWKQRANPLLSIIVPPGPCGLVLQVDTAPGHPPVVDGFVRKFDGSKGVIENSGMVTRGSVLCAINDIDVSRMALKEVVRTLNLSSHLERRFVFRNAAKSASTSASASASAATTPSTTSPTSE